MTHNNCYNSYIVYVYVDRCDFESESVLLIHMFDMLFKRILGSKSRLSLNDCLLKKLPFILQGSAREDSWGYYIILYLFQLSAPEYNYKHT